MSSKQWCRWNSHLAPANRGSRRAPLTNDHGLPVSPALQPRDQKPAREQQPLDSLTPFRKAVAANPYANALATPIRQCNFTGARLPSHHLLPFTTIFRRDGKDKLVPHLAPADETKQTSRAYVVNSSEMLTRLGQKRNWQRLLGHELKFGLKNRSDYQWPSQIDQMILAQLRSTVVRKLAWVLGKPKSNLVLPFKSASECPPSATILHLREGTSSDSSSNANTEYHLMYLLDSELDGLLKGTSYADKDTLLLAHSYMTVSAHVALARLALFLSGTDTPSSISKTR
jgi:hypothetical protein